MALANRTELLADIASWLNRVSSPEVAEYAPAFITLAESRFNRDLRVRQMIKRSTSTLSAGYLALPGDWLEAKQVQINLSTGKPRKLEPVSMEQADAIRAEDIHDDPRFFCIVGSELEVVPTTTENLTVEMAYYAKVPALTTAAPTNWLLSAWPDMYLYGSLVHSAPYLRDDERITTWATLYERALEEINASDQRAQHSGGRLKTRARLRS